jgi:hypothetical protein
MLLVRSKKCIKIILEILFKSIQQHASLLKNSTEEGVDSNMLTTPCSCTSNGSIENRKKRKKKESTIEHI